MLMRLPNKAPYSLAVLKEQERLPKLAPCSLPNTKALSSWTPISELPLELVNLQLARMQNR